MCLECGRQEAFYFRRTGLELALTKMNTADAVPRTGQQSLAANDFFKT